MGFITSNLHISAYLSELMAFFKSIYYIYIDLFDFILREALHSCFFIAFNLAFYEKQSTGSAISPYGQWKISQYSETVNVVDNSTCFISQ